MTAPPKIFCIGFHKTGTTSLYAALTQLGFRVSGAIGDSWTADEIRARGAQFCIDTMENFDAAEDMPWPHFFRELDEAFPGSKFILTVRDPDAWFTSLDNHFGHQETELNAFAYGRDSARAHGHKDHWIATYEAHNARVRDYFQARPGDLLEMNLAEGDGWEKLCQFLDRTAPETPFPVKNTSTRRHSFAYRLKRKLLLLIGVAPHPERLQ